MKIQQPQLLKPNPLGRSLLFCNGGGNTSSPKQEQVLLLGDFRAAS